MLRLLIPITTILESVCQLFFLSRKGHIFLFLYVSSNFGLYPRCCNCHVVDSEFCFPPKNANFLWLQQAVLIQLDSYCKLYLLGSSSNLISVLLSLAELLTVFSAHPCLVVHQTLESVHRLWLPLSGFLHSEIPTCLTFQDCNCCKPCALVFRSERLQAFSWHFSCIMWR